jgi:hypothetical protein
MMAAGPLIEAVIAPTLSLMIMGHAAVLTTGEVETIVAVAFPVVEVAEAVAEVLLADLRVEPEEVETNRQFKNQNKFRV